MKDWWAGPRVFCRSASSGDGRTSEARISVAAVKVAVSATRRRCVHLRSFSLLVACCSGFGARRTALRTYLPSPRLKLSTDLTAHHDLRNRQRANTRRRRNRCRDRPHSRQLGDIHLWSRSWGIGTLASFPLTSPPRTASPAKWPQQPTPSTRSPVPSPEGLSV